jgi:threonine dehydrogenase-like Zn-dependent dehydrogenase
MAAEAITKMTSGRGVDTAIEAAGVPATFVLFEDIVAPGGTIAQVGGARGQGGSASRTPVVAEHHDHDSARRDPVRPG